MDASLNVEGKTVLLQRPAEPWQMVKMGNCGSPIETEAGWLVLTHGVGAMRRYCIGAMLLDLDDPTRVIAQLREPLLCPEDNEREGYVPNVLYLRRADSRGAAHSAVWLKRHGDDVCHDRLGRVALGTAGGRTGNGLAARLIVL